MSEDERMSLAIIRGEIAGLAADEQSMVQACAAKLRDVLEAEDMLPYALIALALVGAEAAAGAL